MTDTSTQAPETDKGPIFVVGSPRSGTSMLHWALVQHPAIWGGVESDFISRLINGANKAYASGTRYGELHWLSKEGVTRADFLGYIGTGIDRMYRSRSNGQRWVEQTPHYVLCYDDLDAMFARASEAGAWFSEKAVAELGIPGKIERRPWGELSFYASDPFGNQLCFVSRVSALKADSG